MTPQYYRQDSHCTVFQSSIIPWFLWVFLAESMWLTVRTQTPRECVSWKLQEIRTCLQVNNSFQRSAERRPHNRISRGKDFFFFKVSSARFWSKLCTFFFSYFSSEKNHIDWLEVSAAAGRRTWIDCEIFTCCPAERNSASFQSAPILRPSTLRVESQLDTTKSWTHRCRRAEKQLYCVCKKDWRPFILKSN